MFAPIGEALVSCQLLLPRMSVHQKERVHAGDHVHRFAILLVYLHRIDKFAPRVRPAAHMHKPLPAYAIVSRIAISLQNAFPLIEKLLRPRAAAAESKVEYCLATGPTVLPQIRLMIGAPL